MVFDAWLEIPMNRSPEGPSWLMELRWGDLVHTMVFDAWLEILMNRSPLEGPSSVIMQVSR